MALGCFSVSLAVKDLAASKAFYEAIGFEKFAGDESQNWLIMKQGDHNIGLFQGMFEKNLLTFNPGWDQNAKPVEEFTDVRDFQKRFKAQPNIKFTTEVDETTSGPGFFVIEDPDGNPILIDQHR